MANLFGMRAPAPAPNSSVPQANMLANPWASPSPQLFGGFGGMSAPAMNPRAGMTAGGPGQGAGGGGSAVPQAQLNMPAYQGYDPYGGASPQLQGNIQKLSQAGAGLMEPGSDYYQRLSQAMQQQIGGQAAAGQRAAALRGAWSGLGAGASPEQMMTQADIGQAGLEAAGQAQAGLALQAPGMGAQMLGQTFSPLMGIEQLGEQSRQFGAGQAEQARQFGVGAGLQQQQLAAGQAWQQAQLQQQQQMMAQQAAMQNQQNQLAMMQLMAGWGGM